MSLSSYVVSLFADDPPFVAIPVFLSRFFRHSCIYVNAAAGIERPEDLIGRTVGTPEYQMTAPVWIRGILADAHGVPVESVAYVTGGLEEPGRSEKLALDLPPSIRVRHIGPDQTLSAMLATRRDRRALHGPGALLVPRRRRQGAPALRGFSCRRTRLLPTHAHLPDHAYGRDPPGHL